MINSLGSNRTPLPLMSQWAEATGAKPANDLLIGTTKVAAAMKSLEPIQLALKNL